jgi:hypothetical protein
LYLEKIILGSIASHRRTLLFEPEKNILKKNPRQLTTWKHKRAGDGNGISIFYYQEFTTQLVLFSIHFA